MALENNSINLRDFFIADVVEVNPSTRRLAVYIPKLMPGIPNGQSSSSNILTSNNPNVSGVSYSQTIDIRNSIWVYPWDFDEKLPKPGSKVIVRFFEGNPKTGYWDKFNPTNNYEIIDNEKYDSLFRLRFAGSEITAEKDDNILINFPETFSSTVLVDGKEKVINLIKEDNYIVSAEEPAEPRNGMLWYNSEANQLYVYRINKFSKVITDEDLRFVYQQIEVISRKLEDQVLSSRLFFVSSLSDVSSPIEGQIVAIDAQKAGDGFFRYDRLDVETTPLIQGFYHLTYANRFIEVTNAGVQVYLNAYTYEDGRWLKMDGWFEWNQPAGNLGDFKQSHNQLVNTTATLTWNFRASYADPELLLKLYSMKFDGVSMTPSSGTEAEITFRFYTGADYATGTKISPEFKLSLEGGVISLTPSIYQSTYFDGTTLYLPDVSAFGVEIQNLKCDLISDVNVTLNLGTITLNAKSSKEVG
jgi:hypothetical protein